MEHLNYCRQFISKVESTPQSAIDSNPEIWKKGKTIADLLKAAMKFILPKNGIVHDDDEFRGIDNSRPLRLPFPKIALEFQCNLGGPPIELSIQIILAVENGFGTKEDIGLTLIVCVSWDHEHGYWYMRSFSAFDINHPLYSETGTYRVPGMLVRKDYPPEWANDPTWTLFSFLNLLQCTNVHIEQSFPKFARRSSPGKTCKAPIPFDHYHILTIDVPHGQKAQGPPLGGTHARPREHLRRGHIRRLSEDHKVWVQSCVVNAGLHGVVTKDYAIGVRA